MDYDVLNSDLAIRFAEVSARTSYEWVTSKIQTANATKKFEEKTIIYEEIINNLLNDKADLERIAGEYKRKYEQITISDEDIIQLQNTIRHTMKLLSTLNDGEEYLPESEFNTLLELISKDTLKTMQLLGFNYKDAIGGPLTKVCADHINNSLGVKGNEKNEQS